MAWFDSLHQKFRQAIGKRPSEAVNYDTIAEPDVETTTNVIGMALISILAFPFQILMLPMKALNLFHSPGVDTDYFEPAQMSVREKFEYSMKRLGKFLLSIPYLLVTAPIRIIRMFSQIGVRELIFIIPALLVATLLGFVLFQVGINRESISNRYAKGVDRAISQQNFQLAKTYFNRFLVDNELTPAQKMKYMHVLSQTGEPEHAQQILDELAPEDNLGYGPAHAVKAVKLALDAGKVQTANPDTLRELKKHLDRSNHATSPELLQAWAVYYQRTNQPAKAIEKLMEAAQDRPSLFLEIAEYQLQLNLKEDSDATLRLAETAFREAIDKDPLDRKSLVILALVYKRLDNWDEAENLLIEGVRRTPDPQMRTLMADFYAARQTKGEAEGRGVVERLGDLSRGLSFDPNYPPIYDAMARIYNEVERGSEQSAAIRSQVQDLVANNPSNAIAHFTLSNILWKDGDAEQQKFHLEQAYKLSPDFSLVLNNLAWVLAHDEENPQLDRALELVDAALVNQPANGKLLDTRGTILLKMKRYNEAITDLSRSIQGVSNKKLVFGKLADAYEAIGNQEQAILNRKMSLPN